MRFTVVSLAMVTMLAGCEAARGVDERLRRIDLLDRVFEPERFRSAPEPVAAETVAVREAPPPAAPEPPAAGLPDPAPAPNPALRTQALLRQQPWLTRFWSELNPAQQARVSRRLPADSAARWDGMGLPDRVALLFGTGG